MDILVDTGILLRLVNAGDPSHSDVWKSLIIMYRRKDRLFTAPQNIIEYWAVSTRPSYARGGLGRDVPTTARGVRFFEKYGKVLNKTSGVFAQWKTLVDSYGIQGKSVHDAHLVASMFISNINCILTLNPADFQRYKAISVFTPQDVLAGTLPISEGP